jgi:hypothetical protein
LASWSLVRRQGDIDGVLAHIWEQGRRLKLEAARPKQSRRGSFNPVAAVLIVALLLSAVTLGSGWYADKVSMPRYCEDVPETMRLLEEVLTKERPAGTGSRVSYLIAAKIAYLQPRQSSESIPAYVERMRVHLQRRCYGESNPVASEMGISYFGS